jgi:polysaccharide biosynthesis protein PslH
VRILVLSLGVPFPPAGGGLTRTFHLLKALASHHQVTLAAFTYGQPHDQAPYPLELHTVPWQWSADYQRMTGADPDDARRAAQQLTYEAAEPWFASVMDPAPMQSLLEGVLRAHQDLVVFEGTPMARFLTAMPRDVPRVLDLFDVHTAIARQAAAQSSSADRAALAHEAQRTLAFERNAARQCDACLAVSDLDAAAARSLLDGRSVFVVPNGVDTSYFVPSASVPEPGALLFTGRMNYEPNVDAVSYFVEEILPLVRREIDGATLHIAGAAPAPQVNALASDAVIVHGQVNDIREHQHRAQLVVVPMRAGGGTRLKVLEAAASGKAMVSTSLGVQGLPFHAGEDVMIADTPGDFAATVVALLRDPRRRQRLGTAARETALRFEWTAIGESFRRIVENVIAGRA